jgi:hypothetical protein
MPRTSDPGIFSLWSVCAGCPRELWGVTCSVEHDQDHETFGFADFRATERILSIAAFIRLRNPLASPWVPVILDRALFHDDSDYRGGASAENYREGVVIGDLAVEPDGGSAGKGSGIALSIVDANDDGGASSDLPESVFSTLRSVYTSFRKVVDPGLRAI